MAAFRDTEEYRSRADWDLVMFDSNVTKFHRQDVLRDVVQELIEIGYASVEMDAGTWGTSTDAYSAIAASLRFPDYFGRNLNALADCLREVEIAEDGGLVVVLWRFDSFFRRSPQFADALLDHFSWAAQWHTSSGRRLLVLLQCDDPRASFPQFGASEAIWNRREWLNSQRDGTEGPLEREEEPDWDGELRSSSVVVFLRPSVLRDSIDDLQKLGYECAQLDANTWESHGDAFTAFAGALQLPGYFGRNLDALTDCLRDLEIRESGGLAVVIWRFDALFHKDRAFAVALVECLVSAGKRHLNLGRRLVVLLQSDDPWVDLPRFGSESARWDPRESWDPHRTGTPDGL